MRVSMSFGMREKQWIFKQYARQKAQICSVILCVLYRLIVLNLIKISGIYEESAPIVWSKIIVTCSYWICHCQISRFSIHSCIQRFYKFRKFCCKHFLRKLSPTVVTHILMFPNDSKLVVIKVLICRKCTKDTRGQPVEQSGLSNTGFFILLLDLSIPEILCKKASCGVAKSTCIIKDLIFSMKTLMRSFQNLTVEVCWRVCLKMTASWHVAPYNLAKKGRRFRDIYCLINQGERQ